MWEHFSTNRNRTKKLISTTSKPKILRETPDGKGLSLEVFEQAIKILVEAKMGGSLPPSSLQFTEKHKLSTETPSITWTKKIWGGKQWVKT